MRPLLTILSASLLSLSVSAKIRAAERFAPDESTPLRLSARDTLDPSLVCGSDFVDCKNGFCCSGTETCLTVHDVPICQINNGTEGAYGVALPYDGASLSAAQTALSNAVAAAYASTTSSSSLAASTSASITPFYSANSTNATAAHTFPTASLTSFPTGTSSNSTSAAISGIATFTGAAMPGRMVRAEGGFGILGIFGSSALVGAMGVGFLLW